MRDKQIYIIDGYNVIHKIDVLRKLLISGKLLEAREGLLRYCSEWWRNRRDVHCFYVVFDGDSSVLPHTTAYSSEIVVIFTKTKQTADDKIIQLLDEYDDDFRYFVVSADQYVVQNAKKRGASIMQPSDFYSILSKNFNKKKKSQKYLGDDKNFLSHSEQDEITAYLKRLWVNNEK